MRRMRQGAAVSLCAAFAVLFAVVPAGASTTSLESGLWYFDRGNVQAAHDAGFDGSGVTVAVIDSQVNPDAIGLRGSGLQIREDSFCFDESGEPYRAVSSDFELASHGTGVASMIIGTGEAPPGGVPVKGVAPGVKLTYYNAGVYSGPRDDREVQCVLENGEDMDENNQFALGRAISEAVDDGADIISISMDGLVPTYYEVAKAHAAGVVIVSGMPNESGAAGWPAGLNGVVAVQAFDENGNIRSSAGGTPNTSDDVKVAAPGVGVITQGSARSWEEQELSSGTSFATPIVAGFLAVVKQKYPDATGNQLIQSLIHNTGTKGEHEPEWNSSVGYGAASLTGMLQVDPAKYPDVNPLFDADDPDALPSAAMVAAAVRDMDEPVQGAPSSGSEPVASQPAEVPWVPWLIGGGIVALLLVVGGAILAVGLSRASRGRNTEHKGES